MANTARNQADCKEFFDKPEELAKKIKQLAELVKKSKHFCAFTGAGISTAAGIADYRSGISTVLDTGAGKWAKQAARKEGKGTQIKKPKRKTNSFKALPTKSHMALVGLMINGPKYLKYLISQNTDGMHRRSGIPVNQMSELHGNGTMEVCRKCGTEYLRDYKCRKSLRKQSTHDHFTGRYCAVPKCGGKLNDTIINFNESLHEIPLAKAEENTSKCDLMLSLGSSLTVSPACDMPGDIGDKWEDEIDDDNKEIIHNLCIVNLQKTPYDDQCSLRIFAKIDDVMVPLMKELGVELPDWNLNRFLKVKIEKLDNKDDLNKCVISGVDIDGINASVFTSVQLRNNGEALLKLDTNDIKQKFRPDEYEFNIPSKLEMKVDDNDKDASNGHNNEVQPETEEKKNQNDDDNDSVDKELDKTKGLVVELAFYGHYKEPNLLIELNDYLSFIKDDDIRTEIVLRLVFDLKLKKWIVKGRDDQMKDSDIGKLWKNYDANEEEE